MDNAQLDDFFKDGLNAYEHPDFDEAAWSALAQQLPAATPVAAPTWWRTNGLWAAGIAAFVLLQGTIALLLWQQQHTIESLRHEVRQWQQTSVAAATRQSVTASTPVYASRLLAQQAEAPIATPIPETAIASRRTIASSAFAATQRAGIAAPSSFVSSAFENRYANDKTSDIASYNSSTQPSAAAADAETSIAIAETQPLPAHAHLQDMESGNTAAETAILPMKDHAMALAVRGHQLHIATLPHIPVPKPKQPHKQITLPRTSVNVGLMTGMSYIAPPMGAAKAVFMPGLQAELRVGKRLALVGSATSGTWTYEANKTQLLTNNEWKAYPDLPIIFKNDPEKIISTAKVIETSLQARCYVINGKRTHIFVSGGIAPRQVLSQELSYTYQERLRRIKPGDGNEHHGSSDDNYTYVYQDVQTTATFSKQAIQWGACMAEVGADAVWHGLTFRAAGFYRWNATTSATTQSSHTAGMYIVVAPTFNKSSRLR